MALITLTQDQVLAQLNSGYLWSGQSWTYSFPGAAWNSGQEAAGFSALAAPAQASANLAVQLWDDLIQPDLTLDTTASGSDTNIEFAYTSSGPSYAWAYFPSGGSVWFNPNYSSGVNDLVTPTVGDHGFLTYIHETGHALGLNHAGDYNGSGATAQSYQDSTVYTVMSYFGPSWGSGSSNGEGDVAWADWVGADGVRHSPQTPMVNDVMAIQSMYGVETTTRTGDTVYGFNSNISDQTAQIFDFTQNANPILTIFDSSGNDTLDLSGWSTASTIDLEPGSYSSANSMTYNIAIAFTADIENAIGGSGNDSISGNALDNQLSGGGGSDVLFGGAGSDILTGGAGHDTIYGGLGLNDFAVYEISYSDATVIYDDGTGWFTISGASIGTDSVYEVEYFTFTDVTISALDIIAPGTGDPNVSISSVMQSVVEGDSGTSTFEFVVSLDAASSSTETVSYLVAGSGANPADSGDFASPMSGTVSFAPGQMTKTISIDISSDTDVEADEGFTVSLTGSGTGLTIAASSVFATITNDDVAAGPVVTADALTLNENEGAGDVDGNVLVNDGGIADVYAVNGNTASVGQTVSGSNGGVFSVAADGKVDFNANGEFEHLGAGESATTQITYSVLVPGVASAAPVSAVVPADGVAIAVIDVNPRNLLSSSGSFTATEAVSGALSDGVITITDTTDLTFSDDNNGREDATSSGEVNGTTWNNISTDNEYQWVLEHPQTGEQITVFQVQVEGSVSQYFWGATGELEAGVTYSIVSSNSNPSASQGVAYDQMVLAGDSGGDGGGGGGMVETSTTVTVTVMGINDAPVTVVDSYTTSQDTALTNLDVLANDSDLDGDALFIIDSLSAGHGIASLNQDGTINYTPNNGFSGSDVVSYTVSDGNGGTTNASANISVVAAPDPNVSISSVTQSVVEGDSGTSTFEFVVSLDAASSSTETVSYLVAGSGANPADSGDFASPMSGTVSFAPGQMTKTISIDISSDTDVEADEGFTVSLTGSGTGLTIAASSVFATITNDDVAAGPVVTADALTLNENEGAGDVDGNVLVNDGGIADVYAVNGNTASVGQTVSGSNGGVFSVAADGKVDFNANGEFEHLGAGESATTQITYSVLVPGVASAAPVSAVVPADGVAIAVIDVNPRNLLSSSGSFTATEAVSGALSDGVITITDTTDLTFSDDNNGREDATSSGDVNGTTWNNISTDNEYQWVLEHPQTGEQITVFQVQVEGSVSQYFWGATGELEAGVTYSIVSSNSNPSASQGVAYDQMVLVGDSGGDGGGDGGGGSGDGMVETSTTVTVTVMGINDAPVTVVDSYTTSQDTALTNLDVLANDSDLDGDALFIIDTFSADHGIASLNQDGTINYTPNSGFSGSDVVSYTVSDGNGGTTNATANISVLSGTVDPVSPADGVAIAVIDVNPRSMLSSSGSFTATEAVSGALSDGVITITDTTDLTFSDDNNGREDATSSGDVNGTTWSNVSTDNEYQWVLEHPQTGEQITVFQVQVEGSVSQFFWGATGELEAGVTYSIVSSNSNPSASQGVAYDQMVLAAQNQPAAGELLSVHDGPDEFPAIDVQEFSSVDIGDLLFGFSEAETWLSEWGLTGGNPENDAPEFNFEAFVEIMAPHASVLLNGLLGNELDQVLDQTPPSGDVV